MKSVTELKLVICVCLCAPLMAGCDVQPDDMSAENDGDGSGTGTGGLYVLNEGNWGSNRCTVDFYDFTTGVYTRDVFGKNNPDVIQKLGDGGNDIGVYGGKIYIAVNNSNLVEVLDASTARHLAQIRVPNCRNLAFDGKYVYVSSYAGERVGDSGKQLGYVARIDTLLLAVIDSCGTGFQPEEMAVCGGKLYVANSGGYNYPDYDSTVSVIDLKRFRPTKNIDVAINLHRMEADIVRNIVYVSSRGDYMSVPSAIYAVDAVRDTVIGKIGEVHCADMTLCGDSLFIYSAEWNNATMMNEVAYSIYDAGCRSVVSDNFITDGTESRIAYPYGIAVNPFCGDIYIADAGDFMTPGTLFCYDRTGRLKWTAMTGDIPGHFAFAACCPMH